MAARSVYGRTGSFLSIEIYLISLDDDINNKVE